MASTSRSCGGAWRSRNSSSWSTLASVSSSTSSRSAPPGWAAGEASDQQGQERLLGPRSRRNDRRALLAGTAPDRHSAPKGVRPEAGGFVVAGVERSQADGPGRWPCELHAASGRVFPAPAGADASVDSCCAPSSGRASSHGRDAPNWLEGAVASSPSRGGSVSADCWSAGRGGAAAAEDSGRCRGAIVGGGFLVPGGGRGGRRRDRVRSCPAVNDGGRMGGGGVDADELEAEVADPVERPVQMCLVDDRAGDHGRAVPPPPAPSPRRRRVALTRFAADDDLVTVGRAARDADRWRIVAGQCRPRVDESTSSGRGVIRVRSLRVAGRRPREQAELAGGRSKDRQPWRSIPGVLQRLVQAGMSRRTPRTPWRTSRAATAGGVPDGARDDRRRCSASCLRMARWTCGAAARSSRPIRVSTAQPWWLDAGFASPAALCAAGRAAILPWRSPARSRSASPCPSGGERRSCLPPRRRRHAQAGFQQPTGWAMPSSCTSPSSTKVTLWGGTRWTTGSLTRT